MSREVQVRFCERPWGKFLRVTLLLVFVKSERAARRVMESITRYLKEELNLPVNQEKSQVTTVNKAAFLGFQILGGKIRVSNKARTKFKQEVRERTKRNDGESMSQVIHYLNEYVEGWVGYFRVQEFKEPFKDLDRFIRQRLRSMQLKKWKNPKKFQRIMIRAGFPAERAKRTWVSMRKWQSVKRREVIYTLNSHWFRRMRVIFLSDYTK